MWIFVERAARRLLHTQPPTLFGLCSRKDSLYAKPHPTHASSSW